MQEQDSLHLKTTNINVRISPMLKMQLIDRSSKMYLNISDYVGFILTKDMSGQNDPKLSDDYKELMQKAKRLQTELSRFQAVAEPYKAWLGRDFPIDGKNQRFEHPAELLQYFATNFKVKG